jgi:hypothetical protein
MFGRQKRGRAAGVAASFALLLGACGGGGTGASGGAESADADLPVVRFQGLPADPAAIPMLVMQEQGSMRRMGLRPSSSRSIPMPRRTRCSLVRATSQWNRTP